MDNDKKTYNLTVGKRTFVMVEFPGLVKNPIKAVQCLGGRDKLDQTIADPNMRLALNFRPEDEFCHPTYGDRSDSTRTLLLHVKHKKSDGTVRLNILGNIKTIYSFQGCADYQFLPSKSTNLFGNRGQTNVTNDLSWNGIKTSQFLNEKIPLFLPPATFARLDKAMVYNFNEESTTKQGDEDETEEAQNENTGSKMKKAAKLPSSKAVLFTDKDDITLSKTTVTTIQTICIKEAIEFIENSEELQIRDYLQELFKDRPIWSKNALRVHIKNEWKLKIVLPAVAYHFKSGPWRSLWVKFGYDPRRDPSSKVYQVFDFRMKSLDDHSDLAGASKYHINAPWLANRTATSSRVASEKNQLKEDVITPYVYQSGVIPPQRHTLYQLIDIHHEDIQKFISANDGNETHCSLEDGWCAPGTIAKIRDKLSAEVSLTLKELEESASLLESDKSKSNTMELSTFSTYTDCILYVKQ
ncbi:General transcription factor 3C polypeptide 5 [Trichoplax sp. H2]|nr:General transcription factor 3C polypeptide 5 [Trichoplax sp. H2]|eukprot:RDD43415.1 General transcription factor 3C polypeptide 5 [Trichoplax sp. H2]